LGLPRSADPAIECPFLLEEMRGEGSRGADRRGTGVRRDMGEGAECGSIRYYIACCAMRG
jgi:hypothetical protein